jgi:hypothetical protein
MFQEHDFYDSYRVPDSHGEVVVAFGCGESGKGHRAGALRRGEGGAHQRPSPWVTTASSLPACPKAVSRHHNLHLHLQACMAGIDQRRQSNANPEFQNRSDSDTDSFLAQIECLCEDGRVVFADDGSVRHNLVVLTICVSSS